MFQGMMVFVFRFTLPIIMQQQHLGGALGKYAKARITWVDLIRSITKLDDPVNRFDYRDFHPLNIANHRMEILHTLFR